MKDRTEHIGIAKILPNINKGILITNTACEFVVICNIDLFDIERFNNKKVKLTIEEVE